MGNLVRLSDYMLTDALAQHAVDTSVALLTSLQHDNSFRVGHPAHLGDKVKLSELSTAFECWSSR